MAAKLTAKQEHFAQLVAQGKSQADAYREAYNAGKMRDERIYVEACEVAKNPKVSGRIRELKDETAKRNALVVDDILNEIRRVATFDPRKLFDENGNMKAIHELDDDTARAIGSVEVAEMFGGESREEGGRAIIGLTKKIKAWDKNAALANAARILGLNDDKLKVKVDPLSELLDHVNSAGSGLKPKP